MILANLVIPGSGYVFLGRSMRGLVMLFWMVIFGYITYHLSSPQVSFVGKISGGIAVWAISCVEVYRIARKRQDN